MLRPILYTLAAAFLTAHTGVMSCDDHRHRDGDFIEDVTVDITGDSGTDFDAFFEDDDRSESLSATVPFSADFDDQEGFFRARVDKNSAGAEELCVRITTPHRSKSECTDSSFGRVTLTIVF
jgi:hypothetical protein